MPDEINDPSLVMPEGFSFGCLPRTTEYGKGVFACAAAQFPVLPRSQWKSTNNRRHVKTVLKQLDGHCAANAAVGALMFLRDTQGLPHIVLSPESLYVQHSRFNQGSTLEENLKCIRDNGVLTRDTYPQSIASRGIMQFGAWREAWQREARSYRVDEFYDVESFDVLCTGLQIGFCAVIGVKWPGGDGGHSVLTTDLEWDGRKAAIVGANSWGEAWNGDGFYRLTEQQVAPYVREWGTWLARSCVVPSSEVVQ